MHSVHLVCCMEHKLPCLENSILTFPDMSDFIVGDDGKPIHRRKGGDYFSEP